MYKSIMVPVDLAGTRTRPAGHQRRRVLRRSSGGKVRLVYVRSLVPVTYMEFVPADVHAGQQQDAYAKLAEIAVKVDLPSDQVSPPRC